MKSAAKLTYAFVTGGRVSGELVNPGLPEMMAIKPVCVYVISVVSDAGALRSLFSDSDIDDWLSYKTSVNTGGVYFAVFFPLTDIMCQ